MGQRDCKSVPFALPRDTKEVCYYYNVQEKRKAGAEL